MPKLVTTHVVAPEAVADFLVPRRDVVIERPAARSGDDRKVQGPSDHHQNEVFELASGPFTRYERTVSIAPAAADGTTALTETYNYRLAIPVWRVLFAVPVRGALRNRSTGGRPWWMPPDHLDARAANGLSLLCVFSLFAGYLGTLLTQTNTYVQDDFGSTDGQLGTMLAAVRIGALIALGIVAVADRRGRRQVLLWSAVAACLITATGALAPNLAVLGISQTFARSCSTAIAVLISIMAVEEMPAGSRAFAVSVLTATAALGAGICVGLLWICDLAIWAWRVLYLVPLLAIPISLRLGRGVPETRRFEAAAGRPVHRRRRWWHAPPGLDRRRLLLLSLTGLCLALFAIPASSFLNDYLREERGFSAGTIIAFQLLTNTPGGIGIVVGGRLADQRGRRLIGAIGVAAGVGFTVAMYFTGGWAIWVFSLLGAVFGAMAVPALGVYGPELFPTAARGWANGVINLFAVIGSATGLYLAGQLSTHFDGFGPAMALLSVGGLAVVVLVIAFYPETADRELEDLNPLDAPLGRELLAFDSFEPDL